MVIPVNDLGIYYENFVVVHDYSNFYSNFADDYFETGTSKSLSFNLTAYVY